MKVFYFRCTRDKDCGYPGGYYLGDRTKEDLVGTLFNVEQHRHREDCYCSSEMYTLRKFDCIVLSDDEEWEVLKPDDKFIEGDFFMFKDDAKFTRVAGLAGDRVGKTMFAIRRIGSSTVITPKVELIVPMNLIKELT